MPLWKVWIITIATCGALPGFALAQNAHPTPILLSGQVAIDDGRALPEPAAIVRSCNGTNPHTEGYTDSSGAFQIRFGDEQAVLQDASETGRAQGAMRGGGIDAAGQINANPPDARSATEDSLSPDRRFTNCELTASLPGFRSQTVRIRGVRGSSDSVGTILLHPIRNTDQGTTVSTTSAAAPKDARKAFDKGQELAKKSNTDGATREFQKAVALYPAYAAAWCKLGDIELSSGQLDEARNSFQQAMKSDPRYVYPYLQISRVELKAGRWPQLAEYAGQALKLDPFDYPQEFLFDAVAHYNLHDFERAEQSIARAEVLDTRHELPQIAYMKGLLALQYQEYAAAIESLRTYLKLAPDADDAEKVREQLKEAEKYAAQSTAKH